MPTIQNTYLAAHPRWIEGMVINMEPNDIVSRVVENAALGFGKVAVLGDADNTVRASAATRKFEGIAVIDITRPTSQYEQYDTAAVMKKGVVAVQASVAVVKGDPVYYVPATGVLTNVANSGANTLIANATWDTSTSGAGLAALRLA